MPRITTQISNDLYEKIEQSSDDMMFDSKSEVINYYLEKGYRSSVNYIDDEIIPDNPSPYTETLRAVKADIDYIIDLWISRINTIQERATKMIELNGIVPAAFIGLVFRSSRPSNEYSLFFYLGILLFGASIVLAVYAYLSAGIIQQSLGINKDGFNHIAVNNEATEGEYLWYMLENSHYPFLEDTIKSTQTISRINLFSVLLFMFGLVMLGSEIIIG